MISFSLIACVLNCFATNVELYILPFGFSSVNSFLILDWCRKPNFGKRIHWIDRSNTFKFNKYIFCNVKVKKLKKFKNVILAEIMLSIVSSSLIIVSLLAEMNWLLYFSIGLFTMLLYPLFPAIGEYCCEFMHPIRESTVMGFLFGIAQLISFGVVIYIIYFRVWFKL